MTGGVIEECGDRSAPLAEAQASEFAAELRSSRRVRLHKGEEAMTPQQWRASQTVLREREQRRVQRTAHELVRLGNREALKQLLDAAETVVTNWPGRRYPESFRWKGGRYSLRTTSMGRVIVHCFKTGAPLVASRFFAID